MERFTTEQPPYSMLNRAIEIDVLPTCARYGMGVLSYAPLSGGWLSGRYRSGGSAQGPHAAMRPASRFDMSLPENQRKLAAAGQLGELADKAGITLIEMAIAFVLRHPAITSAIIGPRTMEHLESQLTAASTVLSDDVLDQIDEIVPPGITISPSESNSPAPHAQARRR
jgi:aryl-alcohol dehydrogenase-like predicted oxidoreductase